jgi:hypothetical protein
LFDAFFTNGKKSGTGLGLAIAHKLVTAHGGRIWCTSSVTPEHPEGKVEFFFTLPVSKNAAPPFFGSLPPDLDTVKMPIPTALADAVPPSDH